ncbi:MAG: hypothetical protein JSW25_07835 [Thermoplasmata archaeon]|nr:MAG: hypothetical protein JSW25_07835 [Thermoplasmata archaeon]
MPLRVTQAGRQTIGQGAPGLRVTQAGRQIIWKQALPERPRIESADVSVQGQVTITSSTYYSPETSAHAATEYIVQTPGGGSNVWAAYLGAVESVVWTSPTEDTLYQVIVRYQDSDGDWSEWSLPFQFQVPASDGTGAEGNFDWADWAQLWNIGLAYYNGTYIGEGGWHKIADFRGPSLGCSNLGGSAGYSPDPKVKGNAASIGRLMGPPSALVNKTAGANNGADVSAKFQWLSDESGWAWQRFYDVEGARAGVVACACGTATPVDPQYGWNLYAGWRTSQWNVSSDFQGVFAFIEPETVWPYYDCCCEGTCPNCDSTTNYCWHAGYVSNARLKVVIYDQGEFAKAYDYVIPADEVSRLWPASSRDRCAECLPIAEWRCVWHPWISVRLKFWHDYDADSTGRTHRIQVGYRSAGQGEADLPAESWLIDETWVGGVNETSVGAGDGGLKSGWSGYGSDRWTGAIPSRTGGFTSFKDLVVVPLDTQFTATPCSANLITPEDPPELPDPPSTDDPIPPLTPCPERENVGAEDELFLGDTLSLGVSSFAQAGIYQFGGYEVAEGNQLIARIRPNPIAPMGYGGEAMFHRLVVVVEHISDISLSVVPILNGERLDQYAQEEVFIGPGDRAALRRYEVPLYRAYEDLVVEGTDDDRFKYGLRGAFFTFEMTIVDLCGIGLQLPGVWVEWEPVRESQNTGIVYTEDLLVSPVFTPTGQTFMGTKGYNRLLKAESGTTDDGVQVEARAFANPIAPEGAMGECEFRRFSLVVTRWNANEMDINVTPYVDGSPGAPITITYQPTTAPVTEITEVDLADYYRRLGADAIERFRFRPRGAWFHVKVETGSGLQEWLTLEGGELEYDVVRESLTKDVR